MKPPQAVVPSGCDTIDDDKNSTQIVVKFTLHSCIHSVRRLDGHPCSLAIRSFPGTGSPRHGVFVVGFANQHYRGLR
jgi:hypothetical protein